LRLKKTTHKTSCINAEYADIYTHHGIIKSGDVKVKYLKGGKICANIVNVDFMENGIIETNYKIWF
jgi:hypothetical protein